MDTENEVDVVIRHIFNWVYVLQCQERKMLGEFSIKFNLDVVYRWWVMW